MNLISNCMNNGIEHANTIKYILFPTKFFKYVIKRFYSADCKK